jgi:hypothetical protein
LISGAEVSDLISRFIGVTNDKLPIREEMLIDSIASEAVRLSLFQSIDNRSAIKPIHITQVKNWAIRKSRSLLDYFEVDAASKISEVVDSENRPNMTFLGDILKLANGYIIPTPLKFITIDSQHSLLISGFPTYSLVEIGVPVFLNGVCRSIVSENFNDRHKQYFFELDRENYMDKIDFEKEPRKFLEYLLSNNEKEKWIPNKYEDGYLGNIGNHEFLFGRNPIKVRLEDGLLSLWRTSFDYHSIYRLKIESRNSTQFSITLPNFLFKRVCLAMDSLSNNKRKAILRRTQNEIFLTLNFVPPAAEIRLIYAIGGAWNGEIYGKISWAFPLRFLEEVKRISSELWISIEEG